MTRAFIRVVDEHTLAFPNYNGNGMYLSMGNLLRNPHVGILFIDFEGRNRMRVNGEASVDFDDELRAWWPEAQFVVRVRAREIFPNCPRYVHRYQKVAPRNSSRVRTARLPCRRGSAPTGPSTCCPKGTRLSIRTRRSSDGDGHGRRRPGHAGVPRPRRHGAEGGAADEGSRRPGSAADRVPGDLHPDLSGLGVAGGRVGRPVRGAHGTPPRGIGPGAVVGDRRAREGREAREGLPLGRRERARRRTRSTTPSCCSVPTASSCGSTGS